MSFEVGVIIPAAGSGLRMGNELNVAKQFAPVFGRPVVCYTISLRNKIPDVKNIILLVGEDSKSYAEKLLKPYNFDKVIISVGSTSRHRTIHEGIKILGRMYVKPEIVIVHDAVRPLIRVKDVEEIIIAAERMEAAGMVRPLVSTVLEINAYDKLDNMVRSLDRTMHRSSEMPQAFQYVVLKDAYDRCSQYDLNHGTECLELIKKYTTAKVHLVEGPEYLGKVFCCVVTLFNFL
ncbi:hypothetical protein HELRODRAFT_63060 [Helobdella robusta]|uniref:2-C-methyl-D-erythritol 4-phosphate cytidylyltransferase n=1 Tax=Helobdella robusta TaxID=6412 RepID=T1FXA5_HELRO|nr:hypothetical protein HELRODRAFT_63060 [Helobdella robusta]ESO13062.1 hypothetical protein HELRODRAFT_63060 [Helobdella robusta]